MTVGRWNAIAVMLACIEIDTTPAAPSITGATSSGTSASGMEHTPTMAARTAVLNAASPSPGPVSSVTSESPGCRSSTVCSALHS